MAIPLGNPLNTTQPKSVDVAVIGSGIGGLTAAALLAKSGKSVLLVEAHDRLGGYCQSFQRNGYIFDAAVHAIGGGASWNDRTKTGGLITGLLKTIGVEDECHFLPIDRLYKAHFPDFSLDVPANSDGFIATYSHAFPHEAKGIRKFVNLCAKIYAEIKDFPLEPSFLEHALTPLTAPYLIRFHKARLGVVLNRYVHDPRAQAALTVLWPYVGLPPSQVSFLYWAAMLTSYLNGGAYYCEGSFQKFADALGKGILKNNGQILLNKRVTKILTHDQIVEGIELDDGHTVLAKQVISNADMCQTFGKLLNNENLLKKTMQNKTLEISQSAVVAFAVSNFDFEQHNIGHETFIYENWDHDQNFKKIKMGQLGGLVLCNPSVTDATLSPDDKHIISLTSLAPYHIETAWKKHKKVLTAEMVACVDRVYPGFKDSITYQLNASPLTMERYSANSQGSIYGWANSPTQVGLGRPGHRTPIKGLFLSGHWTRPGGGIFAVAFSGLQAASLVSGYASPRKFLDHLGRHG